VIGTAGTIRSGAYDLAVRRRLEDARVYAQPCPLFVPLVEEGLAAMPAARLVAEDYLRPLREMDVDVLILGCTHYPLLRDLIGEIMGSGREARGLGRRRRRSRWRPLWTPWTCAAPRPSAAARIHGERRAAAVPGCRPRLSWATVAGHRREHVDVEGFTPSARRCGPSARATVK
jgi:hypothetical protein